MYTIIKSVIENGLYELSDMLKKIDTQWLQSNITDAERDELIALARENANVSISMDDILKKLAEMDMKIKALEEKSAAAPETEEYPEYVVGKWYYGGGKCTFEGVKYDCTAPEGVVCTWSPAEYPPYWSAVAN